MQSSKIATTRSSERPLPAILKQNHRLLRHTQSKRVYKVSPSSNTCYGILNVQVLQRIPFKNTQSKCATMSSLSAILNQNARVLRQVRTFESSIVTSYLTIIINDNNLPWHNWMIVTAYSMNPNHKSLIVMAYIDNFWYSTILQVELLVCSETWSYST